MSKVLVKKYKDKKSPTMIVTVLDSKGNWRGDFVLLNDEPLLLLKALKKELKDK